MYGLKWNNQEDQWDNNGLSSVHGSVIDEDGNAMEGVAVYGGNKQTTTNTQGQYYLYDLQGEEISICLLYTSPSPRDGLLSRMPSSA